MVQRKQINAFNSQCVEWVQKNKQLPRYLQIHSFHFHHARRRFPRRSYHSSSSASSLTEITKLTPAATSGRARRSRSFIFPLCLSFFLSFLPCFILLSFCSFSFRVSSFCHAVSYSRYDIHSTIHTFNNSICFFSEIVLLSQQMYTFMTFIQPFIP